MTSQQSRPCLYEQIAAAKMPYNVLEGMLGAADTRGFLAFEEGPDLALVVLHALARLCLDLFQHCAQNLL